MIVADTLGKVMPQAAQGEPSYHRDYCVGSALKSFADDNPGLALSSSGYLFYAAMVLQPPRNQGLQGPRGDPEIRTATRLSHVHTLRWLGRRSRHSSSCSSSITWALRVRKEQSAARYLPSARHASVWGHRVRQTRHRVWSRVPHGVQGSRV
jgi:hypothetical protein